MVPYGRSLSLIFLIVYLLVYLCAAALLKHGLYGKRSVFPPRTSLKVLVAGS
jgi:hypothetical protein